MRTSSLGSRATPAEHAATRPTSSVRCGAMCSAPGDRQQLPRLHHAVESLTVAFRLATPGAGGAASRAARPLVVDVVKVDFQPEPGAAWRRHEPIRGQQRDVPPEPGRRRPLHNGLGSTSSQPGVSTEHQRARMPRHKPRSSLSVQLQLYQQIARAPTGVTHRRTPNGSRQSTYYLNRHTIRPQIQSCHWTRRILYLGRL